MWRFLLLSFLLVPFLAACSGGGGDDDGRLRVVATTTQIGDFARMVGGGEAINLTVILKPNQDAHDFEPSPSQLRAIANADLVLRNGLGLDAFVNKAVGNSSGRVVIVTRGIALQEEEDDHAEHDDHAGEDETDDRHGNPHVWHAVPNARIMVEQVRDALVAADGANAETYRGNAAAYLNQLTELDSEIRSQIATIPASCRKLVTNHDVLGYYAAAYGLEVVGSIIPGGSTEARPSAAAVAEIVNKVRAERVPAIFAEASVNPALVNQVAREAGVKVVTDLYGDSLGPANSDGGTYIAMMRSNTAKIVNALKDC